MNPTGEAAGSEKSPAALPQPYGPARMRQMTHPMCDGWTGRVKALRTLINVVLGICGCTSNTGGRKASEKPVRKAAMVHSLLTARQGVMLYAADIHNCSHGPAIDGACTNPKAPAAFGLQAARLSRQSATHCEWHVLNFIDVNRCQPVATTFDQQTSSTTSYQQRCAFNAPDHTSPMRHVSPGGSGAGQTPW